MPDFIEAREELEEQVLELLEEKQYAALRTLLNEMNPADLALMLADLPEQRLPLLYRLLGKELAVETFVEMDGDMQEVLIHSFSDTELEEVLDELYVDDAVDLIEEMPATVVRRILQHTDPEIRKSINTILHYPKDSAGSIMTIEYVSLIADMTVEDAFTRIRRTGVDKETIYTCYVTTADRRLIGLVTAKDLLLADSDTLIGDIMEENVIFVQTVDDKEEVAQKIGHYGFLAIPVVDGEQRLVGIVTVDDAIDVIEEETTEDIEKMTAILPSDKTYMRTGVFETWKKRIPWLLLLMLSATFTGMIIAACESALQAYVVLTAYIPMLMGTGGNAGGQASVTIIRGLSTNEIELRDIFLVMWKELRVSLLCGITLSVVNFAKLMWFDNVGLLVAAVVSITLLITVVVAKVAGCALPILAKAIRLDPAVMASPFITTVVDVMSLLVYFWVAGLLLPV